LLTDFLDNDYSVVGEQRKGAFRALLALPDPDLIGYLLGAQIPAEPDLADVVFAIRNKARA
jgi:succinate dehydrogenase flavin-adding protein (antitoxin of CptAB toxin-antitoxin module)